MWYLLSVFLIMGLPTCCMQPLKTPHHSDFHPYKRPQSFSKAGEQSLITIAHFYKQASKSASNIIIPHPYYPPAGTYQLVHSAPRQLEQNFYHSSPTAFQNAAFLKMIAAMKKKQVQRSISYLEKNPSLLTLQDNKGKTILHHALEHQLLPLIDVVVGTIDCITRRFTPGKFLPFLKNDNNGNSVLHTALIHYIDGVEYLLKRFPELDLTAYNKEGKTPCMLAEGHERAHWLWSEFKEHLIRQNPHCPICFEPLAPRQEKEIINLKVVLMDCCRKIVCRSCFKTLNEKKFTCALCRAPIKQHF